MKSKIKRVVCWQCPTCKDLKPSKTKARLCCDEANATRTAARHRRETNAKKAEAFKGLRVAIVKRKSYPGDTHQVARCHCKFCKRKFEVVVPRPINFYNTKNYSQSKARNMAKGLVRAQLTRHLNTRWGCPAYRR